MPTFSNSQSDRNEQRLAEFLLSQPYITDVRSLGRFSTADLMVWTVDGRQMAVEYKRRQMPHIRFYDGRGGLSISQHKIDKMISEYAHCDARRWVVECDEGYYWIDVENNEGAIPINRTKPRAGFNVSGANDSEMGYAYLGKNFRSF